MSSTILAVSVMTLALASASGCEQRAPHATETGDASVTSVAVPVGVPVLVHRADASVTPPAASPSPASAEPVAPPAAPPTPRWVPDAATLTIVDAKDLDRNLGVERDAGGL